MLKNKTAGEGGKDEGRNWLPNRIKIPIDANSNKTYINKTIVIPILINCNNIRVQKSILTTQYVHLEII